ncbi:MAG: Rrf2 family transcriptional regulator [Cyanobacteria bacterium]|nr:Rrf2 family transcriptional regulator [Cyanobacteriota bacterium]MDA0865487.1 Rrf2 family transcriptional regulator [Cyanobacteriota bacterium]
MPFELSCKCEYVLLALLELATHHPTGDRLQIRQIATRQNIPERYLEQLLLVLRKGGLVQSMRGMHGGYLLARTPKEITLLEVLECIEGGTTVDNTPCETQPTDSVVVQEVWQETQQAAHEVLSACTLQTLLERRDAKQQSGMMYYI